METQTNFDKSGFTSDWIVRFFSFLVINFGRVASYRLYQMGEVINQNRYT